jgi:hypothetical protein
MDERISFIKEGWAGILTLKGGFYDAKRKRA